MDIEQLRAYCLAVDGAAESLPFNDTTLVYKVMDKMFAYFSLLPKEGDFFVTLKCDPQRSVELREQYWGITCGYHTDKKYWISVYLKSDVPDTLIRELIDHSVAEVIRKLPKIRQKAYHDSVRRGFNSIESV